MIIRIVNSFFRLVLDLSRYTLMSNKELGMNIYIKEDKVGKYIIFKGEDETKE